MQLLRVGTGMQTSGKRLSPLQPPLISVNRLCILYSCAKLYCKFQSVLSVVGEMFKSLQSSAATYEGFALSVHDGAAAPFVNVPFALLYLL